MSICPICAESKDPRAKTCLSCFNEKARIQRASVRAQSDRELLDAVAAEGLTSNRLAVRLGISRQGAWQRKRAAERRQEALR